MKRSPRHARSYFAVEISRAVERCELRYVLSTLPTGFAETTVASGLDQPTAMEVAPDGRIFVTEQTGALRVIKDGALLNTPFATFNVDSSSERGLLGVTFDPDFATNHFLYVYYTVNSTPKHNRVSRITANGDVMVPGSELVLLELNPLNAGGHNGGAIHFGADGKLYIATGDNVVGANAQSFSTLLGKILRINSDGTIPTDNPFYTTATGDNRAIWAYGLRNPFTFAFKPGSSRMLINDVGQATWEEINDGIAGSNYGWPASEGPTTDEDFRAPLFSYSHDDPDPNQGGFAITGGAFYNPQIATFPTEYVGDYFFADYVNQWIRRLDLSNNTVSGFATDVSQAIVDLKVTPSGDLLVLQYDFGETGQLTRISPTTPAAIAPTVSQHPANVSTSIGGSAQFSVAATGTAPLSYQWQRNEVDLPNQTSSTLSLTNVLAADNGALFRCVVTNAGGSANSNPATLTVTANRVPVPTIAAPTNGARYRAGDVLTFSGSATDPDEGALPASKLSWRIDFHHDTHAHPFYTETSGIASGQVTIPTTGETATNVFYRITLTATDSSGATASVTQDITPWLVSQTLDANVPGATLTLDGQPFTPGRSFASVMGLTRSIGTTSTQTINGQSYEFVRWSDGGEATHDTTAPGRTNTLIAIFRRTADTAPVTATFSPANGTLTITSTVASQVTVGVQSGKVLVRNQGVEVTSLGNVLASRVKRIVLIGGSGNERVDLTGINATAFPALRHVVAELGAGDDLVDGVVAWSGVNSLLGGAGRDTLVGGNGADVLLGDGDADYLYGGGSMDALLGGDGDDTLRGGGGNDTLDGAAGSDLLLESGDANYVLTATFLTGRGTDSIASVERAQLTGGLSSNLIDASSFSGRITLVGAAGNDTLRGGSANDLLRADEGQDLLQGGAGNDSLQAGAGNDQLTGGVGDDSITGGDGIDLVVDSVGGAVTLTSSSLTGNGTDTLSGIELVSLVGANRDDTLDASAFTVTQGSVTLDGGSGDDSLLGSPGSDLLIGGRGNDTLIGGLGDDTLDGGAENDGLAGNAGHDILFAGDGNDTLYGGVGNDLLLGQNGNDTVFGNDGADTINGGTGTDKVAGGSGSGAQSGDTISDAASEIDEAFTLPAIPAWTVI